MLFEYGSHGIQALAKLCKAFLELDGFGFLDFRTEGFERVSGLSKLFVDAAQFERQKFPSSLPHNIKGFVA